MTSDLIAKNEGTDAFEGSGPASDIANLAKDTFGDGTGWQVGIDSGLVTLDFLTSAANPLGTLISAGVGWLLEHIPGISDVWQDLMGDAAAIKQIADTWDNISRALNSECIAFTQASNQIESWSGPARESYTKVADAFEASVQGASVESEALSVVVRLVGGLVAGLKAIVFQIIADFIEFTVLPAILSAIATSWCTFGGSIAVAITYIEIQADIAAGQITVKITRVSEEIVVLSERAAKIIAKLEKMIAYLKELEEMLEANKNVARDVVLAVVGGEGGAAHDSTGSHPQG